MSLSNYRIGQAGGRSVMSNQSSAVGKPLVSVIIPSYNRANMIRDALDSVSAQTHRPTEILVVDDGSTDETARIVREWARQNEASEQGQGKQVEVEDRERAIKSSLTQAHSRVQPPAPCLSSLIVRYLRQENSGGNSARNHGIGVASGEYIAFLDSDDAWEPNKLEKQLRQFEDESVVAVYCGVRHMDFERGLELETSKRRYPKGDLLSTLLVRDVTVQTSAYLIKKSVFEQVGCFDESLNARQDWDMWIRVASAGQIACVPEPLVRFREHDGERTASDPMKEIDAYQRIRQKYAVLLGRAHPACRLQARSAYYKRLGRVHHKHPELSSGEGFRYATFALLNWPFDFDNWAAFGGFFLPRDLRRSLHRRWNTVFGSTRLAIRSH